MKRPVLWIDFVNLIFHSVSKHNNDAGVSYVTVTSQPCIVSIFPGGKKSLSGANSTHAHTHMHSCFCWNGPLIHFYGENSDTNMTTLTPTQL